MHQATPNAEAIFFGALELESSEARSAFLDRVCGHTELRRRVDRLLALDAEATDYLKAPASIPTLTAASDSRSGFVEPGMIIGPYRLLEAMGEGGMGTVYMAEQTAPVRRVVALRACLRIRISGERVAGALYESLRYRSLPHSMQCSARNPYCVVGSVLAIQMCVRRSSALATQQIL